MSQIRRIVVVGGAGIARLLAHFPTRRSEPLLSGQQELFKETNWFAVLIGQGLMPHGRHPVADTIDEAALARTRNHIRGAVAERVAACRRTNSICATPVFHRIRRP